MDTTNTILQDTESIKLNVGMTGKKGWEIKIRDAKIDADTISRLKDLNKQLEVEYGERD